MGSWGEGKGRRGGGKRRCLRRVCDCPAARWRRKGGRRATARICLSSSSSAASTKFCLETGVGEHFPHGIPADLSFHTARKLLGRLFSPAHAASEEWLVLDDSPRLHTLLLAERQVPSKD